MTDAVARELSSAEMVDMAAVTEGATGAGVDTAAPGFQGTLASTGTYTGPETAYFSTTLWNGFMAQPAVGHLDLDQFRQRIDHGNTNTM